LIATASPSIAAVGTAASVARRTSNVTSSVGAGARARERSLAAAGPARREDRDRHRRDVRRGRPGGRLQRGPVGALVEVLEGGPIQVGQRRVDHLPAEHAPPFGVRRVPDHGQHQQQEAVQDHADRHGGPLDAEPVPAPPRPLRIVSVEPF
jgi:hypothetical protein